MAESNSNKQPTRDQEDYSTMSHSVLINHLQTEVKKSKHKSRLNKITDFLQKRSWAWLYYYFTSRFGPGYPYKTYTGTQTGIYPVGDSPVSIALTADWATDTQESIDIANKMRDHKPDYTIHLGDTYYVGAPLEIKENFIGPDAPWVRGSKGSFAVLGNHEMYARGVAFFNKLLPTLGVKNADGGYDGQEAGFFCLENEHWRILGLDTGYHSIGKVPFLEMLPWFAPDCHFDKKLVEWLYAKLKLDDENDKRGLLILTHHQYITAFNKEGEYQAPASQLAELIGKDRPVVWLWGHEHKLSVFEKVQVADGITAYGRCIGHGGMPIELDSDTFTLNTNSHGVSKLVMVDQRQKPGTEGWPLGYNGYVVLGLEKAKLEIAYYDINGKLFSETWTADIDSGTIKGVIAAADPGELKPVRDKEWTDAVK